MLQFSLKKGLWISIILKICRGYILSAALITIRRLLPDCNAGIFVATSAYSVFAMSRKTRTRMDLMHFWRRLSAHCRNCWAATFKDGSLFVCVLNQFWTRSFRIVVTAGFKKTIFRTLTFYKVCYQSQYTIMMRSLNLLLPN